MAFTGKVETLEHKEAFDLYYSFGGARSLRQVARKVGKSATTLRNWAKAFNWQKRVEQRDIEIARKLEKKTNDTIINEKARYREEIKNYMSVIRSVLVASKERFKNGEIQIDEVTDINSLMLAYERLLKLDLLLIGEATEISEHKLGEDISTAREKLKKALENKLIEEKEDDG